MDPYKLFRGKSGVKMAFAQYEKGDIVKVTLQESEPIIGTVIDSNFKNGLIYIHSEGLTFEAHFSEVEILG